MEKLPQDCELLDATGAAQIDMVRAVLERLEEIPCE